MGRDVHLKLNAAINALDLARDSTSIKQTKYAYGTASILLTTTRDYAMNEPRFVELGLACADTCQDLDRRTNGKVDEPNRPVLRAIEQLTTSMNEVQEYIVKRDKRNAISRMFHAKDDEKAIAGWRLSLEKIRLVFDTELAVNTDPKASDIRHTVSDARTTSPGIDHKLSNTGVPEVHRDISTVHHDVVPSRPVVPGVSNDHANNRTAFSNINRGTVESQQSTNSQNRTTHASAPGNSPPPPTVSPLTSPDIRRDVVKTQAVVSEVQREIVELQHILKRRQDSGGQSLAPQYSILGESPPPPPRACFGRDELIESVVGLAENLNHIALIGPGGIGKTSIALTLLHHSRIKERFGDNRRFIRCNKFTPSRANFLNRLSKVIGAGIENPEDLIPLRPSLSSKELFMVLDNAESILDPQGPEGREIYSVVKELSQFSNICLAVTSRITTLPPGCKRMDVPTLSLDAARKTFHRICDNNERPDLIDKILKQLDLHPLSVTLLATVADQSKWDNDRLAREWEQRQTDVLQTEHNESLAATIELSLTSPTFRGLGPNARELLGVIAFLPQGVDEKNVNWLFPTTPDAPTIFDKFCILSLTYQNSGFITMLVPLQDHLRPHHPKSSSLLCTTKERYFARMSTELNPNSPGFQETRWITREDTSVEHVLNVFTSIDENSEDVWRACADFMRHLYWHKPQRTVLGPKVEGLPDDHPLKSECLFELARLFGRVGDHTEQKRLLNHVLGLERERGSDHRIVHVLNDLSDANRMLGLYQEGICQAKEALGIQEQFGDGEERALCLNYLARLFYDDKQLDAAEEAVSRGVGLLPEKGQEFRLCQSHQILGRTYRSMGKRDKAIHHLETALEIASPFNWHHHLFWINFSLAVLFLDEDGLEDAHVHIKQAKPHALNDVYKLGRAVLLEAEIWYQEHRLKEATKEVSGAIEIFEKLGAANMLEACRDLLKKIEQQTKEPATFSRSDFSAWQIIQHLGESPKY